MNNTDPLGFQYPQCDPPLVNDASDINQIAQLAFQIDAEMDELYTTSDNNILTPDGCAIGAGAQSLALGSNVAFNVLRFDNTPGQVMNYEQGILIRTTGLYLATFWVNTTSPINSNLRVVMTSSSGGNVIAEGLGGHDSGAVTPGANATGSCVVGSNAGTLYGLTAVFGGYTGNVSVTQAEFAMVRIGEF